MAALVQIIGVTHNPFLPRLLANANQHPGIARIQSGFAAMHAKLKEARPDSLLVIANDHLNQWFMDNMPAFLIGKAPRAKGPFRHEVEQFGVAPYEASVDVGLARDLIAGGFGCGVDFAFSDEFTIDHSFTVPLAYVHPEAELPIVPLFTNVMAPPLPPAARFYQVGEGLRSIIDSLPSDLRVGVLCSGHLSVEIGGPRMEENFGSRLDPEFDSKTVEMLGQGDVDGLLREATWDRMMRAGNFTSGFLNFVMLAGLARGQPATHAERVVTEMGAAPFLAWDLHREVTA